MVVGYVFWEADAEKELGVYKVYWEVRSTIPGLGRSPGGGHGNPLQYSCLDSPHGQRSLAGYSPWGHKQSDMTEQLNTHIV